jgi:hypothetical protein
MKQKLIATRSYRYATRRLQAGEEFEASSVIARALVAARKASYAPEKPAPRAPVPIRAPVSTASTDTNNDARLDSLRAQAERLGIAVDGRWGAYRLQQEIAQRR